MIQIENEIKTENEVMGGSEIAPTKLHKRALEKFFVSFDFLQSQHNSNRLYHSVKKWSEKWNISENWILDFALEVLVNFKVIFEHSYNWSKQPGNNQPYWYMHRSSVRESVRKTLESYIWKQEDYIFEDNDKFLSFQYKWRDFSLKPTKWFPRDETRNHFVVETTNDLKREILTINEFLRIWKYNSQARLDSLTAHIESGLNQYCDYVEVSINNNTELGSKNLITPYEIQHIANPIWIPSEKKRSVFIKETVKYAKDKIIKTNLASKSLKTFTKSHFNNQIVSYCKNVEKSIPPNWAKVPIKYSENQHFNWLIYYQINPNVTFLALSKKYNVDRKTVSEALKSLAKVLGMTLRKSKITGRPKNPENLE